MGRKFGLGLKLNYFGRSSVLSSVFARLAMPALGVVRDEVK